jgi:hypothetical protein
LKFVNIHRIVVDKYFLNSFLKNVLFLILLFIKYPCSVQINGDESDERGFPVSRSPGKIVFSVGDIKEVNTRFLLKSHSKVWTLGYVENKTLVVYNMVSTHETFDVK